jgi:hypothetical protein
MNRHQETFLKSTDQAFAEQSDSLQLNSALQMQEIRRSKLESAHGTLDPLLSNLTDFADDQQLTSIIDALFSALDEKEKGSISFEDLRAGIHRLPGGDGLHLTREEFFQLADHGRYLDAQVAVVQLLAQVVAVRAGGGSTCRWWYYVQITSHPSPLSFTPFPPFLHTLSFTHLRWRVLSLSRARALSLSAGLDIPQRLSLGAEERALLVSE